MGRGESAAAGEPATPRVADVSPALQEVLLKMNAGAKWRVVVPPALAYGAGGFGNTSGPTRC